MIIYDKNGNTRTWQWLVSHFGPLEIIQPDTPPAYELTAIHERDDPSEASATCPGGLPGGDALARPTKAHVEAAATIIVTVLAADGQPIDQLPVCWSWPDAPQLPDSGWLPRGVVGHTNSNGHVGFPMGGGAYYTPPSRGPHQVWILGHNQSVLVDGLGMIAGTNHRHLDLTFKQAYTEPITPPPIEPPERSECRCFPGAPTIVVIKEIRLRLADIDHLLEAYLDHLTGEDS